MKKNIFFILLILIAFQVNGFSQRRGDNSRIKSDTISVNSLEYELIIRDPGFESWLVTQPPENFYSNDYYANKNWLYVSEWNRRYMTSRRKGMYENYIDYKPNIDYGIDLNYKLYNYFRYFEMKNHVKLIPGSR